MPLAIETPYLAFPAVEFVGVSWANLQVDDGTCVAAMEFEPTFFYGMIFSDDDDTDFDKTAAILHIDMCVHSPTADR